MHSSRLKRQKSRFPIESPRSLRTAAHLLLLHGTLKPNIPLARHSRIGGNPARTNIPRSGQNRDVVPLSRKLLTPLDTPPVLAMTDATVLSEHVATSILVAREGVTMLGDLNETVKRFTQAGAKVTGVVFNAVRPRPGKYSYGYGKYRYSGYAYEQYAKGTHVDYL